MKDPLDRTKVVLRHLPPNLAQPILMEKVDARFAGRYKWAVFYPGKNSHKNMRYSRAYIDFKGSEDVLEFAEFFDGHVFVNERGAQLKAIVEYAPSQRVPKTWSKKDGREGTILKDPEYLEFLEFLSKPIENLPSAEIQLERREAERAGGVKDALIVTPLMEYVRQRRAAKSGSQRSSNGKLGRRTGAVPSGTSVSLSHKRGLEKRKGSTSMYVLRDSKLITSGKEKPSYATVHRKEDQQTGIENSVALAATTGSDTLEDDTGFSGPTEAGKKKVLLMKGKEKEVSTASVATSLVAGSSPGKSSSISSYKQNQRREISGRIIKSILSNKEPRQNTPSPATSLSEQQFQTSHSEKDKRPPRPNSVRSAFKDHFSVEAPPVSILESDAKRSDEKAMGGDSHGFVPVSDKPDRRMRNKDRPDRSTWAPLRRQDGSYGIDESFSPILKLSSEVIDGISASKKHGDDTTEAVDNMNMPNYSSGKSRNYDGGQNYRVGRGSHLLPSDIASNQEGKLDSTSSIHYDAKMQGGGRNNFLSSENGSHRTGPRRVPSHGPKDVENFSISIDGKPSKRGGGPIYGAHEKQVWVQKSGPGS